MKSSSFALFGVLALLACSAASAEAPRLYTNADLQNLPAPQLPASTAPAPLEDAPALALETPRFEAQSPVRAELWVLLDRRVRDARDRVRQLEGMLAAVHDPFVPRPYLWPEDERTWLHLEGEDREGWVSDQLADARSELVEAQAALAGVRGY